MVPLGTYTASGTLPNPKFVQYDDSVSTPIKGDFSTPAPYSAAPLNTLQFTLDDGTSSPIALNYSNVAFLITGGFHVDRSVVVDLPANNGAIDPDEQILSFIDSGGSFELDNANGVILSGSFAKGRFNTAQGSTSGGFFTADTLGLVLTPGPEFKFDNGQISSISDPEGLTISLSRIPGGANAMIDAGSQPGGGIINADLQSFSLADGSVNISGKLVASTVPEPSTLMLLALGAFGSLLFGRRAVRRTR